MYRKCIHPRVVRIKGWAPPMTSGIPHGLQLVAGAMATEESIMDPFGGILLKDFG